MKKKNNKKTAITIIIIIALVAVPLLLVVSKKLSEPKVLDKTDSDITIFDDSSSSIDSSEGENGNYGLIVKPRDDETIYGEIIPPNDGWTKNY